MIVSHHGELEYGSPRVPMFPEALLLHHLDNMDARMECMRMTIAKDRHVESCWTGYSSPLERTVLKKEQFLNGELESVRQPATVSAEAATAVAASPEPLSPALASIPAPPASPRPPRPVSGSIFGEKLQEALRKEP